MGIVNRRQEESAHWSHPLKPKKLATVSAKPSRGMSVSPSPSKSATTSMNLVKCAMMCPKKFVPMLDQGNVLQLRDKNARMLWSRFQDRPSRRNVRLNTLRSVVSLVIVDMETNHFFYLKL